MPKHIQNILDCTAVWLAMLAIGYMAITVYPAVKQVMISYNQVYTITRY